VRANVPGSGPGWRGTHFVWGGPCVHPRAHTKWASQVRPLLGPQGDLVTPRRLARARRAGPGQRRRPSRPSKAPACLPACPPKGPRQLVSSARAAHYSLQEGARARRLSTPVPVCLSVCVYIGMYMYVCMYVWHRWAMPTYIGADVWGGACEGVHIHIYIYIYRGVCISICMDATGGPYRHISRPMTMCVPIEVSVYGARGPLLPLGRARLSGADKSAPRPTGHPRGARAPGLCRPQCLCVSISVCRWRAPLPAGLPPQGPPPTGHLPARAHRPTLLGPAGPRACPRPPLLNVRSRARARPQAAPRPVHAGVRPPRAAPPTAPTRPANWPPPSPTARSPARLPLPLPSSPSSPSSPSLPRHPRARTPAGPRRRRPPGPYNGARARLSARYEGRARRPDSPRPGPRAGRLPASDGPSPTHTHRPRAARNRACKRSRVRKSFRGEAHFRWQTARLPRGHVPRPTGHRPSSPGGGARGSPAAGQGARAAISAGQLA
jgi:hypothetical protein